MKTNRPNAHSLIAAAWLSVSCALTPHAYAQCSQPIEIDRLLASDPSEHAEFGFAVAISGDVAVIGAHRDDDNGLDSGSAYVYRFNGSHWIQESKLTASDGEPTDDFGYSVGISGDTIVIGAERDDNLGDQSGSAYIYQFNGTNWVEKQILQAADGVLGDAFGHSVAIDGNTLMIGAFQRDDLGAASGAVYAFNYDGTQWVQSAKLHASDGAPVDFFGQSVAISGDTAVVGASQHDQNGLNSGAAYIFKYDGSNWNQLEKLLASDGDPGDLFGYSVSISGDTIVVGAPYDDDNGLDSGSAYVFYFDRFLWAQQAKFFAFDGAPEDLFGYSVAIAADTILIGSPFDSDQSIASGSAYVFERTGSFWSNDAKLLASNLQWNINFGWSVALSGSDALIGEFQGTTNDVFFPGAAHVFDLNPPVPPCPADMNNDCNLDFFDVSEFLTAFGNQDPAADFNADTLFDFFDVSNFLAAFAAGCP